MTLSFEQFENNKQTSQKPSGTLSFDDFEVKQPAITAQAAKQGKDLANFALQTGKSLIHGAMTLPSTFYSLPATFLEAPSQVMYGMLEKDKQKALARGDKETAKRLNDDMFRLKNTTIVGNIKSYAESARQFSKGTEKLAEKLNVKPQQTKAMQQLSKANTIGEMADIVKADPFGTAGAGIMALGESLPSMVLAGATASKVATNAPKIVKASNYLFGSSLIPEFIGRQRQEYENIFEEQAKQEGIKEQDIPNYISNKMAEKNTAIKSIAHGTASGAMENVLGLVPALRKATALRPESIKLLLKNPTKGVLGIGKILAKGGAENFAEEALTEEVQGIQSDYARADVTGEKFDLLKSAEKNLTGAGIGGIAGLFGGAGFSGLEYANDKKAFDKVNNLPLEEKTLALTAYQNNLDTELNILQNNNEEIKALHPKFRTEVQAKIYDDNVGRINEIQQELTQVAPVTQKYLDELNAKLQTEEVQKQSELQIAGLIDEQGQPSKTPIQIELEQLQEGQANLKVMKDVTDTNIKKFKTDKAKLLADLSHPSVMNNPEKQTTIFEKLKVINSNLDKLEAQSLQHKSDIDTLSTEFTNRQSQASEEEANKYINDIEQDRINAQENLDNVWNRFYKPYLDDMSIDDVQTISQDLYEEYGQIPDIDFNAIVKDVQDKIGEKEEFINEAQDEQNQAFTLLETLSDIQRGDDYSLEELYQLKNDLLFERNKNIKSQKAKKTLDEVIEELDYKIYNLENPEAEKIAEEVNIEKTLKDNQRTLREMRKKTPTTKIEQVKLANDIKTLEQEIADAKQKLGIGVKKAKVKTKAEQRTIKNMVDEATEIIQNIYDYKDAGSTKRAILKGNLKNIDIESGVHADRIHYYGLQTSPILKELGFNEQDIESGDVRNSDIVPELVNFIQEFNDKDIQEKTFKEYIAEKTNQEQFSEDLQRVRAEKKQGEPKDVEQMQGEKGQEVEPTIKENLQVEPEIYSSEQFKQDLLNKFNLPKEQTDAVMKILEARAKAIGETTDEYINKRISGISKTQDIPNEENLFQEAEPIDTKAFKNWFGDSKVVDEDGNPLVVYHGTPNANFDEFNSYSYFTPNKEYADIYQSQGASSISYKKEASNPNTYSAYLSIKKPFDTRNKNAENIFIKEYQAYYSPELTERGLVDWMEVEELAEWLKENYPEFDGIIADEGETGGYGDKTNLRGISYIPFLPQQIKSVKNQGTFDPNNPNIYMQEEEKKDLVVIHNIKAEGLKNIDKIGGIPVPSIAISNKNFPLDKFGEITLIADKSLIDPLQGSNKVFNADIYSPRYPTISYFPDRLKIKELKDDIKKSYEYLKDNEDISLNKSYFDDYALIQEVEETRRISDFLRAKIPIALYIQQNNLNPKMTYSEFREIANNEKYKEFAENLFNNIVKEEKIFTGYTNSGNRRYVEHNLQNLVKIIKKELRDGEGFNYGLGSLRSNIAKKLKSIKDIIKNKKNIAKTTDFEKIKEEYNQKFTKILDNALDNYEGKSDFRTIDIFLETLKDGIKRKNIEAELSKYGFANVDMQAIKDFLKEIENMSTEYFEAKIQREVKLNEFEGAIIPEDSPQYVTEILNKNGITNIQTYKNEEERASKIENFNNLFFQKTKNIAKEAVEFTEDGRAIIHAFENADVSTVVHELGHIFRKDLTNDELAKAEKWAGVENRQWNRENEEKFARAFENYLRKGKSPITELQSIFEKFKKWLSNIYKTIKGSAIDVKMTKDVIETFDNLFKKQEQAISKMETPTEIDQELKDAIIEIHETEMEDDRTYKEHIDEFISQGDIKATITKRGTREVIELATENNPTDKLRLEDESAKKYVKAIADGKEIPDIAIILNISKKSTELKKKNREITELNFDPASTEEGKQAISKLSKHQKKIVEDLSNAIKNNKCVNLDYYAKEPTLFSHNGNLEYVKNIYPTSFSVKNGNLIIGLYREELTRNEAGEFIVEPNKNGERFDYRTYRIDRFDQAVNAKEIPNFIEKEVKYMNSYQLYVADQFNKELTRKGVDLDILNKSDIIDFRDLEKIKSIFYENTDLWSKMCKM